MRATSRAAMVRPRPVPLVLARGRGVLLLERLEDFRLLLGRDADAGVRHRETQADLSLGRWLTGVFHQHHDLAAFGELDGVAHEVE